MPGQGPRRIQLHGGYAGRINGSKCNLLRGAEQQGDHLCDAIRFQDITYENWCLVVGHYI
jgi:hypothetical protein